MGYHYQGGQGTEEGEKVMVMKTKDAGILLGGILLDAAIKLDERAKSRGNHIAAVLGVNGMQIVEEPGP